MQFDLETAKKLNDLTNDFYDVFAESFSSTRQGFWEGWKKVFAYLKDSSAFDITLDTRNDFSVFDLGCGNLRFEGFLTHELATAMREPMNMNVYAVDNSEELTIQNAFSSKTFDISNNNISLNFQKVDLIYALIKSCDLGKIVDAPKCDLSACMALMHHIPLQVWRKEILRLLINKTKSGALIIISFWQFENDEEFKKKAIKTTQEALRKTNIEISHKQGDYLLGWQNNLEHLRYCHSFSNKEIDELVDSIKDQASLVCDYNADGKTHNMNRYIILRTN